MLKRQMSPTKATTTHHNAQSLTYDVLCWPSRPQALPKLNMKNDECEIQARTELSRKAKLLIRCVVSLTAVTSPNPRPRNPWEGMNRTETASF